MCKVNSSREVKVNGVCVFGLLLLWARKEENENNSLMGCFNLRSQNTYSPSGSLPLLIYYCGQTPTNILTHCSPLNSPLGVEDEREKSI